MNAWVVSSSVISPLAFTSEGNYSKIRQQISGLSKVNDAALSVNSFFAGQITTLNGSAVHTKFEIMCKKAAEVALDKIKLDPSRTLYMLSTTKGNIELLNAPVSNLTRLALHATAKWLASEAGFQNSLVVSNACI